jgi:thiamine-phosphate pyrophosphorylase
LEQALPTRGDTGALIRTARRLEHDAIRRNRLIVESCSGFKKLRGAAKRNPRSRGLPSLLFLTDPWRTPDLAAAVAALPRGSGVVYRAFGDPNAVAIGLSLAALCRRRGLVLLIGADEALAARVGADGLHLPERGLSLARRIAARRKRWILTAAAHSRRALALAAAARLDAALLSPVFESRSPSAGSPLGPLRFARLVRRAGLPVYALGGIDHRTAPRLVSSGAAGLAAVKALSVTHCL